MKKILIISISVLLASCVNHDTRLKDSVYANRSLVVNTEKVTVSTHDSLFLQEYNVLSSCMLCDSLDLIVAYNYKLHALDLFAVQGDYSNQILLEQDGANGIEREIEGICLYSLDSIWVYSQGIIYLTDTTGVVKKKIDIGRLQNEEIIIKSNYSISRVDLYYNKLRNSLFYSTRVVSKNEPPRFYVYEYFLSNNNIHKYELSQSEYDSDIWSMYGWKNAPNITFSDADILYNYPIESTIYTIHLSDGSNHSYGGTSKNTENMAHRMTQNVNFADAERHKIENVHFYELIYNATLDLYFRLHVDKSDFYPNVPNQFSKKDRYLMIFNHDFEVVYESKLPPNRYGIIESWCSVNKGLLMFVSNHFLDVPLDENTILLDVLEPQI